MIERIARYFNLTESAGLFVSYFTTLKLHRRSGGTANPAADLTEVSPALVPPPIDKAAARASQCAIVFRANREWCLWLERNKE
jgi:hypothetical protein